MSMPHSHHHPRTERLIAAFVWMSISALGFSLMLISVKRLGGVLPQFELIFFRSIVNCLIVAAIMLFRRESFNPRGKPLLLFRGVAGFLGMSCLFYAVSHLPLSVASMLNWSSPVFVLLFSRIFMGERVAWKGLLGVAVALIGLILLLRPGFHTGPDTPEGSLPWLALGVGVLGAAAGGIAYVAVRAATARVGVYAIVFYFTATASLISAPLAINEYVAPTAQQWAELLYLGGLATLGQIAMTQAYRHAAAGLVSVMSLQNAAFAALFGWFFFGEVLLPVQWLGLIIMGFGIGWITLMGQQRKKV